MGLKIFLISEDGSSPFLSEVSDDLVEVGREPREGGIKIDSRAISRAHGLFMLFNQHWFFKDLGSSNGSWLNGQHLSAGEPYLLRSGDELQLADSLLRLQMEAEEYHESSVLVFCRGEFFAEIMARQVGKVLSVGGAKSDLKLDVDLGALPQFMVEKRSDFLCVQPISTENMATLNDQPLDKLIKLEDRDCIVLSPYRLLLNIPQQNKSKISAEDNPGSENKASSGVAGWEDDEKTPRRTFFGQFSKQSSTGESDGLSGDMREIRGQQSAGEKFNRLEEKVVFIVGILLVFFILSLLLWWFIR